MIAVVFGQSRERRGGGGDVPPRLSDLGFLKSLEMHLNYQTPFRLFVITSEQFAGLTCFLYVGDISIRYGRNEISSFSFNIKIYSMYIYKAIFKIWGEVKFPPIAVPDNALNTTKCIWPIIVT